MDAEVFMALRSQIKILASAAACDALRDIVRIKGKMRGSGLETLDFLDSEAARLSQPALTLIAQLEREC